MLCRLAVYVVASQSGADERQAADALEHFAERGEASYKADAWQACLIVAGKVIVHTTREWLTFHAHSPEWDEDPPADDQGSTPCP
jgi:hypothetical protein